MGDGTNDEYPVIYDQVNPTLSAEKVTNGDFATDSDWIKETGWTISGGTANRTNTGTFTALQQNILTSGKTYKVTFTISSITSGEIYGIRLGSNYILRDKSTTGTYTGYGTANGSTLSIMGNQTFAGSVDNVSIKEVQGNPATMTNMLEGNITNQYPLTKIRNYYRMGDGILDGYPIIQDQTSPNLAHIPTTNLIEHSERFTNGYDWTVQSGLTVTDNFATAPNGTQTASKIIGNGSVGLYQIKSITGNAARSVYLKSITGNVNVKLKDPQFTVTTLTLDVTTEWQRFELSEDNGTTLQGIWIDDIPASGIYIWGAQLEEQSQATAYLKSDGIAAIRKSSTTNLIPYSEDFENAAWSISELSFGSKVTSPIGTNDAITIIETDATAQHNIYDEIVGFTNEAHTLSCYAKLGTSSNRGIFLRVRDGNTSGTSYGIAWYNLSDGTFTMSGGISANIENVGNGWYRCSLTVTAPSGSTYCLIGLANGNSNYYDGDGTSNVLIWGSQVEKQTQAETYAKTTYGLPVTIDLFTENNYGTMTNMSASDIVEDTP